MHERNAGHYNDPSLCLKPDLGSRDQQCGAYRGRADTAQTIAIVGYVAGGALGVASALLFMIEPTTPVAKRSAIRVEAGPGSLQVDWSRSF